MAPDFDLRLRTMASALQDVILPAIQPGNSMATEQLKLVLGSIDLLRAQIDYGHAYEQTDARGLIALIAALEPLAGPSSVDLDAAEIQAAQPICSTADIRRLNIALRSAACALIAASAGREPAVREAVRRRVLDHEKRQIARERAWVLKTGFDNNPEEVSGIAESLGMIGAETLQ